jgi:lipoprotein-anchoring transpeptidase ErfK/SrfK
MPFWLFDGSVTRLGSVMYRSFCIRVFCGLAALGIVVLGAGTRAEASVVVHIDRSSQRMAVMVDGVPRYNWRVSTARAGYVTPPGVYHPQMLARRWYSKKYYNSPMPHSIFFYGGFAIHGTYEISQLGGPASHGCVRLDPGNAATLYGIVEREGMGATTIVIH